MKGNSSAELFDCFQQHDETLNLNFSLWSMAQTSFKQHTNREVAKDVCLHYFDCALQGIDITDTRTISSFVFLLKISGICST